jgi:hypothetical protein
MPQPYGKKVVDGYFTVGKYYPVFAKEIITAHHWTVWADGRKPLLVHSFFNKQRMVGGSSNSKALL